MKVRFVCYEDQTFTQEQVNTLLAEEKRKHQKKQQEQVDEEKRKQQELVVELEKFKKTSTLTVEAKETLEKRIEDLQNQYMTAEEKARQATENIQKQNAEQLELLTKERDSWQHRHSHLLIDTEITKSAVEHKAYFFEQVSAILRPNTKLVEKLGEDGKPTGEYAAKVMFVDTDKNGKPITLELTIPEAVKRMTELTQYGNLFEGGIKGGVGGTGSENNTKIDLAKIAKDDPARYRKMRKEQPELFK